MPAMHRDYPGLWVVRDDVAIGLLYWIDHMDGSQTWRGTRRGTDTWASFGSKQEALAWVTG